MGCPTKTFPTTRHGHRFNLTYVITIADDGEYWSATDEDGNTLYREPSFALITASSDAHCIASFLLPNYRILSVSHDKSVIVVEAELYYIQEEDRQ